VDFLLVLIELFFARCYGWGATSEIRWTRCSAIAERPRCRVHYSFRQK